MNFDSNIAVRLSNISAMISLSSIVAKFEDFRIDGIRLCFAPVGISGCSGGWHAFESLSCISFSGNSIPVSPHKLFPSDFTQQLHSSAT